SFQFGVRLKNGFQNSQVSCGLARSIVVEQAQVKRNRVVDVTSPLICSNGGHDLFSYTNRFSVEIRAASSSKPEELVVAGYWAVCQHWEIRSLSQDTARYLKEAAQLRASGPNF